MNSMMFYEAKPPKDWNERLEITKSKISKESVQWRANLNVIGGHIKSGAQKAKANIKTGAEKAQANVKSMTQQAKEKEIGQKMGQRLSMVFKKNKDKNQDAIDPKTDNSKHDDHFI